MPGESEKKGGKVRELAALIVERYYGYEDSFGENTKIVKELQTNIVQLGYNIGNTGPNKNGIDGIFGKNTEAAIEDFQRDYARYIIDAAGEISPPLPGINIQREKKEKDDSMLYMLTMTAPKKYP